MKDKLNYETPATELILVRIEENVMSVTDYSGFGDEENWN